MTFSVVQQMGLCEVGVFSGPVVALIQQHKRGCIAVSSQLGLDRSLAAGGSLEIQD
jgi:hypothetical protein